MSVCGEREDEGKPTQEKTHPLDPKNTFAFLFLSPLDSKNTFAFLFLFSLFPRQVKPGACAVESLPAPGSQYASDVCKGELARLMRR